MLNKVVKYFLNKETIIIGKHRNSNALINKENKQHFFFISPSILWKLTFIVGRKSQRRYQLMGFILNVISPKYIIDINWTERLHTLYFVWCKNKNRKFIVVQHGTYAAGLITDIPHRMAKCTTFLAWSQYFKKTIEKYNSGKKLECIVWGNPVYNQYNRDEFTYKPLMGNKILIAPSLISGERLDSLNALLKKLTDFGFDITVKEHLFQPVRSKSIEGYAKITGPIYSILATQEFDVVITDISSVMNDIIFFKSRAIFFSPPGDQEYFIKNVYSGFMNNLAKDLHLLTSKEYLCDYVNIDAQEALFKYLVHSGSNNLDLLK